MKNLPEGAHLWNYIEITDDMARRLKNKFLTPCHVATIFPEKNSSKKTKQNSLR